MSYIQDSCTNNLVCMPYFVVFIRIHRDIVIMLNSKISMSLTVMTFFGGEYFQVVDVLRLLV